MEPYFDSCAIMSYAFSWAGSAPGPISPMWWMEYIYDYAVTRIPREKIFLGIPGFGFNWRIDRKPAPGSYRGSSGTFLGFLGWQQGEFTFHAEQARIPFAGCHDHGSMSPHLMLHIYDCLEGQDACDLHPRPSASPARWATPGETTWSLMRRRRYMDFKVYSLTATV
jgi:hypothetical protein